MLLQHLDAAKPIIGLVFGVLAIYAILACLRLPPQSARGVGAASSPGVLISRTRRNLWRLAGLICLIDVLTVAAYLGVWSAMKDVEKPMSFPAGKHLYGLWEGCLLGVAIQVGLGVLFVMLETKLKASK